VGVAARNVLDLTDVRLQAMMPAPMADLLAEDWRAVMGKGDEAAPQAVGRAAYDASLGGLIVPSRARENGVNVLIFPQRLGATDRVRVLHPELLEKRQPVSPSARLKLTEADRLAVALGQIMPPGSVGDWLRTPNPAFEGQTPMQVMERGESDRLWRMIHQIDAAVAS
jgi:hypothetical protein